MRDDLSAASEGDRRPGCTHDEELERERAEREAGDQAIHEKMVETETGGLKLNAAGVWWLFSGTVCSTFPQELAGVVNWIRSW